LLTLIRALVVSKVDYCNSVLLSVTLISTLLIINNNNNLPRNTQTHRLTEKPVRRSRNTIHTDLPGPLG